MVLWYWWFREGMSGVSFWIYTPGALRLFIHMAGMTCWPVSGHAGMLSHLSVDRS